MRKYLNTREDINLGGVAETLALSHGDCLV